MFGPLLRADGVSGIRPAVRNTPVTDAVQDAVTRKAFSATLRYVETRRRANSSFDDMAFTDGIAYMSNAALIQQVLDRVLGTLDFSPLAARLAEDVVFEVTPPEGVPTTAERRGKQAVLDYFTSLGDIVTFWQVRCLGDGDRVVAVGAESFTIPRYGITLGGEFALLLTVCNGLITRFLIIEELSESSVLELPALENA